MTKHEGMPNDKMTNDRDVASSMGLRASFFIKVASVSIQPAAFKRITWLALDESFVALNLPRAHANL
jgi:hypothetical protein